MHTVSLHSPYEQFAMALHSWASTYDFDKFFFTLFRLEFLKRKSPFSSFELCSVTMMSLAAAGSFIQVLTALMSILQMFYATNLKISEICKAGGIVSVFLIIFFREVCLIGNRKKLNKLFKDLEELFPFIKENLLKSHLRASTLGILLRNRIMQILYTYGCIASMSLPVLMSCFDLIVRGQEYPYRYPLISWYPFDDHTLLLHPLVYVFQIAVSFTGVAAMFNEDLIFSTSVTQISMHYRQLGDLLLNMDAKSESVNSQKLKELVRYQYAMEGLRNDVDEIFSLSTFIGFTVMKVTLCMFVFSTFHGMDIAEMLRLGFGVLALIVPVFLRCFSGTELYEASASLLDSLYNHNWYEGTPTYRKVIGLMMVRANKPLNLHASTINYICVDYFKEIAIGTYEFIMFLHNFSS